MPEFRTSGEKEERIIDLGKVYERVEVDFDEENDKQSSSNNEHLFVGDKLKENNGSIIRIFYNNCNGIDINRLINQKVKEHFERKKKSMWVKIVFIQNLKVS